MRKSRYTDEQIIGFIKQVDAGMSVADLCRREGFSSATFYKWRAKFGGMEASDAKRLRDLEAQNSRLKKLLAEAVLDNEALKVAFGVKRLQPSGFLKSTGTGSGGRSMPGPETTTPTGTNRVGAVISSTGLLYFVSGRDSIRFRKTTSKNFPLLIESPRQ